MAIPPRAQHTGTNTDSLDENQSSAPPNPASPQLIPLRLRDLQSFPPPDPSPGRSPHTTPAPLFTGALESSSAPEYPAQAQARAPHTTAAPLWNEHLAVSSAPPCAQMATLDEKEEAAFDPAISGEGKTMQGHIPFDISEVYPPAYGNQEQQLHPAPESPSHPPLYSATDLQYRPWNEERGSTESLQDDGDNFHSTECLRENSHAPVGRVQAWLPPGSIRRQKVVLSCCLVMIVLAIVVGVIFGVNKSISGINTGGDTFPHGPEPTATNTFGNGTTQGSTSTINPTPTPANMLDGLLTTSGLREATTSISIAIATTSRTITITTIAAVLETTTKASPSPTPTISSCEAACSSKQYSCTNGCVLSGDTCMEKCKDPSGCGCIDYQVNCYVRCNDVAEKCKAQCPK